MGECRPGISPRIHFPPQKGASGDLDSIMKFGGLMGCMLEQDVSRILFPEAFIRLRDNDHSSSLDVTIEVERPTRELGRTTLNRSPIWSFSWWGLPSSHRHRRDW